MKVEKGFNSDLEIDGEKLHLQTEDWGRENPYIVSRIYRSGAVIKSIKTPYGKAVNNGDKAAKDLELAVRHALRVQHNEILDQLISGQLLI